MTWWMTVGVLFFIAACSFKFWASKPGDAMDTEEDQAPGPYGTYEERWDRAYENIKQGGVVPYWETNTLNEHWEAQRNIMSRLIRNIKALEDEVEALKRTKEERND